jgi:hypothetical protein
MTDSWFLVSYVLLWLVVLALVVLVLALYRELGRLYLKTLRSTTRDGPRIGAELRDVSTRDSSVDVSRGKHMLLFGLEGCTLCERLMDELGPSVQAEFPNLAIHLFVQTGEQRAGLPTWAKSSDVDAHAIPAETTSRLAVRVSPFAIYVADGTVKAKGLLNHGRDLLLMGEQHLEESAA